MEALRIFWVWWRDQLLDLVPGLTARRHSRASDGLILSDPDTAPPADRASSVLVSERRDGVERVRGRVPLDELDASLRAGQVRSSLPIVLRLPASLLLERDVVVPLAAERDLGRVLFHEMDRFTPFSPSEVLWTHALRGRDRARGRLTARLSLVQKAGLEPVIGAFGAAGLPVACLELLASDGERRRIFLDQPHSDDDAGNRVLPALAVIGLLVLVAAAVPFIRQSQAAALVEQRIVTYAPAVARVRALRAAASAGTTGSDAVAAERRRAGDALEAIALLTDALPDDTYLTSLTYDAGKLTLDGQSKSAAALIAPLTANRRLQGASFTAPVVRNTLGLDTFSVGLRVSR